MKTIVWDVDDVLNNLMRVWFEQEWLPKHPSCKVRYETISQNPPHELLGVHLIDYLNSLDQFRLSEGGRQLSPVPEVLAWFRQYGHRYRHIVLTATPLKSAPIVAEWVIRHFGDWIRSFNFVPSQREGQPVSLYDRTKADYLRWWSRADILIDDNSVYMEAAKQMGIHAVLMPRPWNQSRLTIAQSLDLLVRLTQSISNSGAG
jgi:hypothetical protein